MNRCALLFCLAAVCSLSTFGIEIPSDGSDGVFHPTANVVVDLGLAPTGHWSDPGGGNGVYDPEQWTVVFKFQSITIPSGVTVTFKNHPSYAPVIWLSQGDVVIHGTVSLNGAQGHDYRNPNSHAEPGPGGFRGGQGRESQAPGSGGHGPGGGQHSDLPGGGSHGTVGGYASGPVYGSSSVFPLIGGSGGGAMSGGTSAQWGGGGGGGGAILLATPGMLSIEGTVSACGGNGGYQYTAGGGSGGTIRLIAEAVVGTSGQLLAYGGRSATSYTGVGQKFYSVNGGNGRILVEADSNTLSTVGEPPFAFVTPPEIPRIWRDETIPAVRIVSVNGLELPLDPNGKMTFPAQDLQVPETGTHPVVLETSNVPTNAAITVRLVNRVGSIQTFAAALTGGNETLATWQADVALSGGFKTIQAHAVMP